MSEESDRIVIVKSGSVFILETPSGYHIGTFYNIEAAEAEKERIVANPEALHFIEAKEARQKGTNFPYLKE
jgi:hypothetical protein